MKGVDLLGQGHILMHGHLFSTAFNVELTSKALSFEPLAQGVAQGAAQDRLPALRRLARRRGSHGEEE